MADKLVKIVEDYFGELSRIHRLGAGTDERSYYPAVANLLNAIGADLKPRVHCISDVANTGAGHPDFGLYAASQLQKGEPRKGQSPERGVIEMKSVAEDVGLTAKANQTMKYSSPTCAISLSLARSRTDGRASANGSDSPRTP